MDENIKDNYIEQNKWLLEQIFDLNEVFDFITRNNVEIIKGSDHLYECHINSVKLGDSIYTTELDPLTAMVIGIKKYKDHVSKSTHN